MRHIGEAGVEVLLLRRNAQAANRAELGRDREDNGLVPGARSSRGTW
jgi:hypothetical protein